MTTLRFTPILLLLLLLSACSVSPQNEQIKKPTRDIVSVNALQQLPKKIGSFSYIGTRLYPKPWGASSRYIYTTNKIFADVYSYPVPKEAISFSHKNRVIGMTKQAIDEISGLTKLGKYSKFEILNKSTFQQQGRTSKRIDTSIVKDGIALYSLIFLSENKGRLLKIRMSMPDSKSNRANKSWQKFAEKVFSAL